MFKMDVKMKQQKKNNHVLSKGIDEDKLNMEF